MNKKLSPKKEDKQVAVIEKEMAPIVKQAISMKIANPNDMTEATEVLSKLNIFSDRMQEEKERITKPANEILKAERSRWKPLETMYDNATTHLRSLISAYQTEQVRKQREEEAKIAARVGDGKGKLKIETAVKKIEELDAPIEKVSTESGMLKFREDKKLKITDASVIPRMYLVVDEKKVLEALKAGIEVKGAEIELIQVPINFR